MVQGRNGLRWVLSASAPGQSPSRSIAPWRTPGKGARVSLPDLTHRAAIYVRMSTDLQPYSPANQRDAIRGYAQEHGLEIVREYADEGRSGLDVRGRGGLCALLNDVTSGRADFRTVLVYDVSRWGRFQDCDESAFYEHLCRRAGVRVEYCMEPFRNDDSPMSAIIKGLKRAMAGEFSRELSVKVAAAKQRILALGFRAGGPAGFGFRRELLDARGNSRGILDVGPIQIHNLLQAHRPAVHGGTRDRRGTEFCTYLGRVRRRPDGWRQHRGRNANSLDRYLR